MTFEHMKDLACKHFKVSKSQLDGKCRKAEIVYARIALAKILRNQGYKFVEIASMLNVNHSSVIHYINTFDDRVKYDVIFANTFKDFSKECQ